MRQKWIKKMMAALAITICLVMAGCQESDEAKYSRAQKLLNDGKYDEAVKVFDEISTYEDSSKMSMYSKAIGAAEAGDYDIAFSAFDVLRDYKDCSMLITYYTARQYESEGSWEQLARAAETYDMILLFKDSQQRAEKCRKTIYDEAISAAASGEYARSVERLNAIYTYKDSDNLSAYYDAFRREQLDQFLEASYVFSSLGDYKDSKEQTTAVLKRGYEKAEVLEKEGRQEEAYQLFISLGDYSDSFERANKPYYDLGMEKKAAGEWDAAVNAFKHAGNYSDAKTQVQETYYAEGDACFAEGDWPGAVTAFKNAGSYNDAYSRIPATYYAEGETESRACNWEKAINAFSLAGDYNDAAVRVAEAKYNMAKELLEAGEFAKATEMFASIADYADSATMAQESQYQKAKALLQAGKLNESKETLETIHDYADASSLILQIDAEELYSQGKFVEAYTIYVTLNAEYRVHDSDYQKMYDNANALYSAGDYTSAFYAFEALGCYKDSSSQSKKSKDKSLDVLIDSGKIREAMALAVQYGDLKKRFEIARAHLAQDRTLSVYYQAIGITPDGKIKAVGWNKYGQCDVEEWTDITAVFAGDTNTIGLRADGTAAIAGEISVFFSPDNPELNGKNKDQIVGSPDQWRDLVQVQAYNWFALGLRSDGTVAPIGFNYYSALDGIEKWTDIIDIASDGFHFAVGLKVDGTVVYTGEIDDSYSSYTKDNRIDKWEKIIDIEAGGAGSIFGLTSQGIVLAFGFNAQKQCEVQNWRNIVAISASSFHTVGLCADGTVVAVGANDKGQCDVNGWTDIVAIAAGSGYTIGMKKDGTLVTTCGDEKNIADTVIDVDGWVLCTDK